MAKFIRLSDQSLGKVQRMDKKALKRFLKRSLNKKSHHNIINITNTLRQENLICPICKDLLISPTLLRCGHAFCLQCLDQWFLKRNLKKWKHNCPLCRAQIQFYECSISDSLKRAVQCFILLNPSKATQFHKRWLKYLENQANRAAELQEGKQIDYFDQNDKKWKSGLIDKINSVRSFSMIVRIKATIIKKNTVTFKLFDFPFDSRKIARHRCYTS